MEQNKDPITNEMEQYKEPHEKLKWNKNKEPITNEMEQYKEPHEKLKWNKNKEPHKK